MSVSLDKIIEVVAICRGVDINELLTRTGRRSKKEIAIAKQIICYVATGVGKVTETDTARKLSYKHHTAVIFGKKQLERTLDVDANLQQQVKQIIHVVDYYQKATERGVSV